MFMSNEPTTQMWRDFHYGKKQKRPSKKHWTLFFGDQKIVEGSYALCRWKMNQMAQGVPTNERNKLKII